MQNPCDVEDPHFSGTHVVHTDVYQDYASTHAFRNAIQNPPVSTIQIHKTLRIELY